MICSLKEIERFQRDSIIIKHFNPSYLTCYTVSYFPTFHCYRSGKKETKAPTPVLPNTVVDWFFFKPTDPRLAEGSKRFSRTLDNTQIKKQWEQVRPKLVEVCVLCPYVIIGSLLDSAPDTPWIWFPWCLRSCAPMSYQNTEQLVHVNWI